ncbi:metal-dependent transcriptional regulator [Taibaiella soli]|uniref:Transcriptional regulator MntR n=1 Tax=Taibaiella soli TaxID=1649169 RepID=A0A2W2AZ54_9BACT|nr:metal-dependent transcriptional regulator [Taibaiella soli]PZF72948.1 metal-dependent transcriptional regulator [Taibaiella soli]
MQALTLTEENYLKSIYTLQHRNATGEVSVNEIAERMQTKPATVTDMLRKLSEKELIHYEKYKKIQLSESGIAQALQILRKHRLWETFLHDKLQFSWDEVHEVAEQLEHIHSKKLIESLDAFLGFPKYDPHGDPIPNAKGEMPVSRAVTLLNVEHDINCQIVAVKDSSTAFLQQLERFGLQIGVTLQVKEQMAYDNSILVQTKSDPFFLSEKTADNILVIPVAEL